MSAIGDTAALQAGVEAATAESGGLMELAIIRPSDMPALMEDYLAGSADAALLLRLVLDTTARINRARPRARLLCVACPRELQRGYAVVAAIPARDNPCQAIALAVCPKCGPDMATIEAKAMAGFSRIWSGARRVNVTHQQGGRA